MRSRRSGKSASRIILSALRVGVLLAVGLVIGTVLRRWVLIPAADHQADWSDLIDSYALDLDTAGRRLPGPIWDALAATIRTSQDSAQQRLVVAFVFSESNCHQCVDHELRMLCQALRRSQGSFHLVAVGSGTEPGPVVRFLSTVCRNIPFAIDGEGSLLRCLGITKTPVVLVIQIRSHVVLRAFFASEGNDLWYKKFVDAVLRLSASVD